MMTSLIFPQPCLSHDAPCLQSATHRHPQHKYLLFYEYAEHLYEPSVFLIWLSQATEHLEIRENPSLTPPGYTGAWHLDKMFIIKMNRQSPSQSILTPARISSPHLFVAFNTWGTLTPWLHPAAARSSLIQRFFFLHLNVLLFLDNSVHTCMHIQCIWSFSRIPYYPLHRPPAEPLLFPESLSCFLVSFVRIFVLFICVLGTLTRVVSMNTGGVI